MRYDNGTLGIFLDLQAIWCYLGTMKIVLTTESPKLVLKASDEFTLHQELVSAIDGTEALQRFWDSREAFGEEDELGERVGDALDPYGDTVLTAVATLTEAGLVSGARITWE